MSEQPPIVINTEDAQTIERKIGSHWGAAYKILPPGMRPRGGSLGVNLMTVPTSLDRSIARSVNWPQLPIWAVSQVSPRSSD